MSAISRAERVREVVSEAVEPVPPAVPGEFVVRLGVGWGGPLHDLANALAVWGHGDAVEVLLSALEFVEIEAEGVEASLVEGMRRLRGAVMTDGIEAAGGAGGSASQWRAPAYPGSQWECLCPRKGGARVRADRALL